MKNKLNDKINIWIDHYIKYVGVYEEGLTQKEIKAILAHFKLQKLTKKSLKTLNKDFNKIAGCNTGIIKDGKFLMYRHDVERFLKALFLKEETYFD